MRKKIIYEKNFPYFCENETHNLCGCVPWIEGLRGLRAHGPLSHNNVSRHRTIQGSAAIPAVASDVGAVDSSS